MRLSSAHPWPTTEINSSMNDHSEQPGERLNCQLDGKVKLEPPDADLLASFRGGEAEAFWRLWNRHQERLHQVCLMEMDGHVADAEDALSQVMLKAMDRIPSCAGKILLPEAWLRRLARNLCIDLRRERERRSQTAENWKTYTLAEQKSDLPILQLEAESDIQQRIAGLPPLLREAFVLHVDREIPVSEVASQLGISSANVRKRIQLARNRLRRDLQSRLQPVEKQTPPATPVRTPIRDSKPPPRPPSTVAIQTVRVKLPCGVEHLFHVFHAKSPSSQARRAKSLQSLQGYLRQHPGSWKKRLELAELFHVAGCWREAVAEWQRALGRRWYLPAVLKLGETLLKLDAPQAAIDLFTDARRQCVQSAATQRHLDGWIAFCRKEGALSAAQFQAAADLEPENPAHWHALALAHRLAEKTPQALAAITRALQLNPNDVVALSLGHDILLATGQFEEAVRRARHLLTLAPFDLLTMRRLVECRCQLGFTRGVEGVQTKKLLGRALRLAKDPLLMRRPLAAFFLSQGQPDRGLAVHREFVERHPHCPHGRQHLSQLLAALRRQNHPPAEITARKSPAAKPCHAACLFPM